MENGLQDVRCNLINVVVEPVGIECVGMAAPGTHGLFGGIVIGIVVYRNFDGLSGGHIPLVFIFQGALVIFRMSHHEELAVATALMEDQTFGEMKNGWKVHGFWGELFAMGPISRRLLKKWLNYPASYFAGKKAVYVDAVHGSMLMVDGKKFLEAGGYDEGIFLYQEETVLAKRLQNFSYRSVLLLDQKYRHEHSVSIKKSFKGQMDRQKLRNKSVLYYMKHYLKIGPVKEAIAKLWFAGIMLEIQVAGKLGI